MAPRSLVFSDRIGDFDKNRLQDFAGENLRSSPRHSCAGEGLSSWDVWIGTKSCVISLLERGRCVIDRGNEIWSVLRMWECYLLFKKKPGRCIQNFFRMLSCRILFCIRKNKLLATHGFTTRFVQVCIGVMILLVSFWDRQLPKSQIWKRTGDVSYKTWMDGPWCCRSLMLKSFQASQAAEWYQACFPVHPWSGDVMSLTSGQCQAEWNFGLIQICKVYIHWPRKWNKPTSWASTTSY